MMWLLKGKTSLISLFSLQFPQDLYYLSQPLIFVIFDILHIYNLNLLFGKKIYKHSTQSPEVCDQSYA